MFDVENYKCPTCGVLVDPERIRDAYEDSQVEKWDGYCSCDTFSLLCKKCSEFIEIDDCDME